MTTPVSGPCQPNTPNTTTLLEPELLPEAIFIMEPKPVAELDQEREPAPMSIVLVEIDSMGGVEPRPYSSHGGVFDSM